HFPLEEHVLHPGTPPSRHVGLLSVMKKSLMLHVGPWCSVLFFHWSFLFSLPPAIGALSVNFSHRARLSNSERYKTLISEIGPIVDGVFSVAPPEHGDVFDGCSADPLVDRGSEQHSGGRIVQLQGALGGTDKCVGPRRSHLDHAQCARLWHDNRDRAQTGRGRCRVCKSGGNLDYARTRLIHDGEVFTNVLHEHAMCVVAQGLLVGGGYLSRDFRFHSPIQLVV